MSDLLGPRFLMLAFALQSIYSNHNVGLRDYDIKILIVIYEAETSTKNRGPNKS